MGCCCSKQKDQSTDIGANASPSDSVPATRPPPDRERQAKSRKEKSVRDTETKPEAKPEPQTQPTATNTQTNDSHEDSQSTKSGESAYGKRSVRKEPKKKALSRSNYNTQGLVDKKSKEYELVKTFLAGKKYNLLDSIGSGNYAEVYKAEMPERRRMVAIKVIDLTKTNDNYRLGFLQKEIAIIQQLKHPSIIKHYEVAQHKMRVFMIMEFCGKGTMTDWLRERGPFNEPMAWDMDTKILDGLNYMHSNQIAHRDLKLENILITDQNYPKITDFSYTVVVDESEAQSTTFCGSIPYFAPEILQRKPHNPLVSDVWSLGICFYVMVCDGLPFRIDDEKQMLAKQLDKEWDFKKKYRNKLSNEFKQMIRDMLEPDMASRANTQQLMNCSWIKNKPKTGDT